MNGARGSAAQALLLLVAAAAAAVSTGCAGALAARSAPGAGSPSAASAALAGWQAAIDGRRAEAESAFDRRLAESPHDLLALFGRATAAYARGDGPAALESYAVLVAAAASDGAADPWAAVLAPVAAARASALDGEVPAGATRALAERLLLAPEVARAPALSWPARLELARLADEVTRRSRDPEVLEQVTAAAGCARAVFEAGNLGPLPHLDLDRKAGAAPVPASDWRPAISTGCRVSAAPWQGRQGAEVLRAAVEVEAGAYEIVLDLAAEARLSVDGGKGIRHGSEVSYGPRVSAARVWLPSGRHDLEIRFASSPGRTELALLVFAASGKRGSIRFVDPRRAPPAGVRAAAEPLELLPPPSAPSGPDPAVAAVMAYARGFVAERLGRADEALAAAAHLGAQPRFALGLALAATLAHGDPTRPASLARDAARTRLREALAVDRGLGRAWYALSAIDLEDEHTREAIDDARAAAAAAPGWSGPELVLAQALRARGLDYDADQALDRAALRAGPVAGAPCALIDALLRRAELRRDATAEENLATALSACDPESEARADRLRARGELDAAAALLAGAARLAPDRDDLQSELASVLWAAGRRDEALAQLARLVARDPRDPGWRLRLADAQAAAGQTAAARETVRQALLQHPDVGEVLRAARALGAPLPLDAYRLDGRTVIREFEASGRHYAAPAVVLLDRTVGRVFPDGAQMILTHEIVRVQSKDAIDRWGEVEVPSGAEILTLRTHKPDGTTREPEEIAGKETISAPDLAIGDYVEWETLEEKPASDAFTPGFLGDRFYFQSFDAPLDRSEYLLVTPRALPLDIDARAGSPLPAPRPGDEGTTVTTFAATRVPQLFAERSAVPAIEYVPSVRVSSRVTWQAWARFLAEQLYGTVRSSPAVRELAKSLAPAGEGRGDRTRLAAAMIQWVTENVEATDELRDPASFALARGRGNRIALALALARELGISAAPVLARSRLVADADATAPAQEIDDFGEMLVRLDVGPRPIYVDLRLRHAAFGYLPPALDGARVLALDSAMFGRARSGAGADLRTIDMTIRLDDQGGGVAVATEQLTGWPALEWAELVDRVGADRAKLRQDFEQHWLGVQFPGARLRDLDVDLPNGDAGTARVRYSFVSPQLAVKGDHEIRLSPTFFRSQPGRRFATEPKRSTTLMLGFDVPFRLTATVELPGAATVDPAPASGKTGVIARRDGYRFVEDREVRPGVLVLRRESALPIMRVTPGEYAGVAADLRRVDGLEQQEIHIRLRPRGGAK
jgi:tetratricopeptide (TPR) repeat protein